MEYPGYVIPYGSVDSEESIENKENSITIHS